MEEKPDPILTDPNPKFLHNPISYITIMDPQLPVEPTIIPAAGWKVEQLIEDQPKAFPAVIDLLQFNINTSINAATFAMTQHIQSKFANSTPNYGIPEGDAVRANFEGRMGELVVAITTNRFLEFATGNYNNIADLDGDEIKTRGENPKYKHLLVPKGQLKVERRYWLVIGNYPVYKNMGWTTGTILNEKGELVDLGPRGKQWGMHKDKLYNWMPNFDSGFHIRDQLNQQSLPLEENPFKVQPAKCSNEIGPEI